MPYVIDNTKPWLGRAIGLSIISGTLGFWIGVAVSQSPTVLVDTSPTPIETYIEQTPIDIPTIEETIQPDMPLSPLPDISFGSDDDDDDEYEEDDD